MSDDLVFGFPVCSHDHRPVNMRFDWMFASNGQQREHWYCPICKGQFRCAVESREIPEGLRLRVAGAFHA